MHGWIVWFGFESVRIRYVRTMSDWNACEGAFCFYSTKRSLREALSID